MKFTGCCTATFALVRPQPTTADGCESWELVLSATAHKIAQKIHYNSLIIPRETSISCCCCASPVNFNALWSSHRSLFCVTAKAIYLKIIRMSGEREKSREDSMCNDLFPSAAQNPLHRDFLLSFFSLFFSSTSAHCMTASASGCSEYLSESNYLCNYLVLLFTFRVVHAVRTSPSAERLNVNWLLFFPIFFSLSLFHL